MEKDSLQKDLLIHARDNKVDHIDKDTFNGMDNMYIIPVEVEKKDIFAVGRFETANGEVTCAVVMEYNIPSLEAGLSVIPIVDETNEILSKGEQKCA